MDISGEHQLDVDHNIFKRRLDSEGKPATDKPVRHESKFFRNSSWLIHCSYQFIYRHPANDVLGLGDGQKGTEIAKPLPADYCGSCYGAESTPGACCNTCDEVQDAYRKKGWSFTDPDGIEQVSSTI